MSETFGGFPGGTLPFLMELAAHNDRDWFKANEARYEKLVRGPALELIRACAEPLKALSPHLVADARKVGGSLMRLHRDTRFSKDKTPYKTNVGIQFRHGVGKDVHAPGLYIHIEPGECFVGFGLWQPEPDVLLKLREAVAEKWPRWSGILAELDARSGYTQYAEGLKRVPKGFDPEHPAAAELRRTSYLASHALDFDTMHGSDAVERVMALALPGRDYMAFLCEALSLPF